MAVPLAAAVGVLVRFALRQYLASPLYTGAEAAGPADADRARRRASSRSTLPHAESFAREDFLAGPSNAAALALIERWPDGRRARSRWSGPEGSGKSHLAAIWANGSGARFLAGRALGTAQRAGGARDRRAGGRGPRRRAASTSAPCSISSTWPARSEATCCSPRAPRRPPGLGLPDLASRLRALPAVTLAAPDDALLRAVLVKLFADRQLAVDEGLLAIS